MRGRSSMLILGLTTTLLLSACGASSETEPVDPAGAAVEAPAGAPEVPAGVPEMHQAGATAYVTYCGECHGNSGEGSDKGPPHVNIVYEPNHHPDQAFQNAARLGVRAHHWEFGDMEPVEGIGDAELDAATAYVRWLQQQAGIR